VISSRTNSSASAISFPFATSFETPGIKLNFDSVLSGLRAEFCLHHSIGFSEGVSFAIDAVSVVALGFTREDLNEKLQLLPFVESVLFRSIEVIVEVLQIVFRESA
jgi:hypothetical protein